MLKNKTSTILYVLILAVLNNRTFAAEKYSKPSNIVAFIDSTVVTSYDLEEFKKVIKLVNISISSEEISEGKNLDESYINIVKKANIARKNGISLTKEEKSRLWFSISTKSGDSADINSFCRVNKVSRKFLDSFLEDLVLWQKHLNENIKRLVAGEIDENLISDYMEYIAPSGSEKTIYDLSRVSLGYADPEQRAKAMLTLNRTYSKLKDKKSVFKLENLEHTKVEKIMAIPENELHSVIIKNLKNVEVGDAS
ncbi:MAG: hypothetical protein LBP39_01820, partial [Rickettsiales bacterium]|nr:hypothetical protein [Rickettsiales bacterium]